MNNTARSTLLALTLAAVGWLAAGTAHAEKADRDKPIGGWNRMPADLKKLISDSAIVRDNMGVIYGPGSQHELYTIVFFVMVAVVPALPAASTTLAV